MSLLFLLLVVAKESEVSASTDAVSNLVPETVRCFEASIPESYCKESFIFFTGQYGEDDISLNEDSEELWPCVQESGADGRQELVCLRHSLSFSGDCSELVVGPGRSRVKDKKRKKKEEKPEEE